MEEWNLYEDNQDLLTEKLIEAVKSGDKSAEWRLILIFKSEIIRACSKLAMRLNTDNGRRIGQRVSDKFQARLLGWSYVSYEI